MPPRGLLFSPDERIAHLITPVFGELGIELQRCSEIFAAVEQLTRHDLTIIIADWTQELEASFFLKTARELKTTKPSCLLAIVSERDIDSALQLGADGVLTKPLISAQVRNTLSALDVASLVLRDDEISDADDHASLESSVEGVGLWQRDALETITNLEATPEPEDPPHSLVELAEWTPLNSFAVASPLTPSDVLSFSKHTQDFAARLISKRPRGRRQVRLLVLSAVIVCLCLEWRMGYLPASLFKNTGQVFADSADVVQEIVNPSTKALLSSKNVSAPPAPEVVPTQSYNWQGFEDTPTVAATDIQVTPILPPTPPQTEAPSNSPPTPAMTPVSESEPESAEDRPAFRAAVHTNGANPQIPASLLSPALATNSSPATPKSVTSWIKQPVTLSEEASHALLVYQAPLVYPVEALKAGIEGSVLLQACVDRDGSVRDLKLVNGYMVLGRAAFDSVKQWKFKPYRLNGEIVETQTFITVNFRHPVNAP